MSIHLQIGHINPELGDPMAIGIWRAYFLLDEKLIAKLNFLVTPLTHWQNRAIDYAKAREVNHGPLNPYRVTSSAAERWLNIIRSHLPIREPNKSEFEVKNFFKLDYQMYFNLIKYIFLMSQVKVGWRLERWVDALVNEYYEIVEVCNASEEPRHKRKKKNAKLGLQQCVSSDWSSLSPDTKSDIRSLCQR